MSSETTQMTGPASKHETSQSFKHSSALRRNTLGPSKRALLGCDVLSASLDSSYQLLLNSRLFPDLIGCLGDWGLLPGIPPPFRCNNGWRVQSRGKEG